MAEQAIILIPDISGFTGFTGATEIDHAAHIITELLELIVASNETDFTLAEIEVMPFCSIARANRFDASNLSISAWVCSLTSIGNSW
jgi:hypothetical protein